MSKILSLNPSLIVQGGLTFLASLTWVDFLKEIVIVSKQTDPVIVLRLKFLLAIMVTLIITLVLVTWPITTRPSTITVDGGE